MKRIKLKIQYRKLYVRDLVVMFAFLLLCRPVAIYGFGPGGVNEVYSTISKIVFLMVGLCFCARVSRFKQGIILNILVLYGCYAVSTLLGDGDFRRLIMQLYPILGMIMLTVLECKSYDAMCRFVGCISRMFCALVFVNFLLLPFSESWFGGRYFLGIENQIGYALLIGFMFVALDRELNGKKCLFVIYVLLYFVTILCIFSGSNIIGAIVIALYIFVPFTKRIINKRSLSFFFGSIYGWLYCYSCLLSYGFELGTGKIFYC